MAIPRFIISNPYRILGIPANSTEREIVASIARQSAYARVGKLSPGAYPLPHIGESCYPVEQIEACSVLRYSTSSRLKYAMMWFSVVTPEDSRAMELLARHKTVEARELLRGGEGYSAAINLAVNDFIAGNITDGIGRILTVITTDNLRNGFLQATVGKGTGYSVEELLQIFVDHLLEYIPFDRLSLAFSGCDAGMDILNRTMRKRWLNDVESLINTIKTAGSNRLQLIADSADKFKQILERIREITPVNDSSVEMLSDSVARAILNKSIDIYNAGVTQADCKMIIRLIKDANAMACSSAVKNRCKENYSIIVTNLNTL